MKITNKLERVFSVLIALVLSFGIVATTASLDVYAAGTNYGKYSTLDAVPENITIYKIIESGKISAVQESGAWYYQFSNSDGYVKIKASAFTNKPKNTNLEDDNDHFEDDVTSKENEWKTGYSRVCYYYKRTTSSKTNSGVTYSTYKTSIYRFELEFIGSNTEIEMTTTLTDGVSFTYSSKVPVQTMVTQKYTNGKKGTVYKTTYQSPSTAAQYVSALTRSSSVDAITPTMEVILNNNSKGDLFLSKYKIAGKGNANTKTSISTILKVVTATASTSKSLANAIVLPTPSGVYAALSSVYSYATTVRLAYDKSSKEYNTGKPTALTYTKGGTRHCVVEAKLASPIKLYNDDDFVTYTFTTANAGGKSNTDGVTLDVNFSFT